MEIKGYDNLVFFDTETTGLEADKNRIIELAAIRIGKAGKWQMDCFIKLPDGERIPDKISELTHITDEMLEKNGVTEEEAAAEFSGMLMGAGNTLLIAHNAQFDLNFTAWMIARQQRPEWMKAFSRASSKNGVNPCLMRMHLLMTHRLYLYTQRIRMMQGMALTRHMMV